MLSTLSYFQQSPLDSEPKLSSSMELRAEAEDVGSFLQRVSDKTGVKLKASPNLSSDRLVLYSKGSIRDTLAMIAAHFDWTWSIESDGTLMLRQSVQQQAEEAKNREEQILAPLLRWQLDCARDLSKASTNLNNHSDLDQHIATRLAHRQTYGDIPVEDWNKQYESLNYQSAAFASKYSPTQRLANEFAASLGRRELLTLANDGKAVSAYFNNAQQHPFNSAMKKSMEALARLLDQLHNGEKSPEQSMLADILDTQMDREQYKASDAANAVLWVKIQEPTYPTTSTKRVSTSITLLDKETDPIYSRLFWGNGKSGIPSQPYKSSDNPDLRKELLGNTELTRAIEESSQDATGTFNRLTKFANSTATDHPARSLARLLTEVASAGGVQFISDCYDTVVWSNFIRLPISTVYSVVDTFAVRGDADWKYEGGWVSCRTRYWQLRRQDSVDTKRLLRIRDTMRLHPQSFDDFATVFSTITWRQSWTPFVAELLAKNQFGYSRYDDLSSYYTVKFWGQLSPQDRSQLASGQLIPYGSLKPTQRESIRLLVLHLDDERYHPYYGLTQQEEADLAKLWPGYGGPRFSADTTVLLPQGIPTDAKIGLTLKDDATLEIRHGEKMQSFLTEGQLAASIKNPQTSQHYQIFTDSSLRFRTASQTLFTLTIMCGPQKVFGTQRRIRIPGTGDFVPYAKLPASIRESIEAKVGR